ncbi:S-adenosyl-L-methionine-dependent methyltransferase [Xylariales sp. PMI_506]|nr:S-adenosyl-L-methionine-dependent methyltransferase [Xylariales sp. PMI_506]
MSGHHEAIIQKGGVLHRNDDVDVTPELPKAISPRMTSSASNEDQLTSDILPRVDVMPGQLAPALQPTILQPPTHIYSEAPRPNADPILYRFGQTPITLEQAQRSFADQANDLINAALGRTPVGGSVIDPDSVLGESGRLYHGYKEGTYFLPNDAAEQDRLDFQSRMFTILLDGWLGLAPMTKVPSYVLDIATGTGIWALEFAERFPSSFVIGTDLSAIQPNPNVPNCYFVKDDSEGPWVFPAPHPANTPSCTSVCSHNILFDYIHLRAIATCFNDTRVVMQHAYNNMKSGGWIEIQDVDFEVREFKDNDKDSILQIMVKKMVLGAAALGRDINRAHKYKQWLEEAGFVDVTERQLIVPYNPWPQDPKLKEVGYYMLMNMLEGMRGISWKMLSAAGLAPDEIEKMVVDTEEYIKDCGHRPYLTCRVIYGRRP